MRDLDNGEFKRIRKDVARRLYNEGRTIYLTPSNVVAGESNIWVSPYYIAYFKIHNLFFPIRITNKDNNLTHNTTFDSRVNSFEYYNCNAELGYYTNFWIKKEEVK